MPGERIVYLFMASLEAVNDFAFSFFLKKKPSFFFVGGLFLLFSYIYINV